MRSGVHRSPPLSFSNEFNFLTIVDPPPPFVGPADPQVYLNNIQLDVWYYRLVLYTFELQAVMEESNSSSLGSEKAAKVKPRRTKSSRPSYASKSREVLVPVVCVNFFFLFLSMTLRNGWLLTCRFFF